MSNRGSTGTGPRRSLRAASRRAAHAALACLVVSTAGVLGAATARADTGATSGVITNVPAASSTSLTGRMYTNAATTGTFNFGTGNDVRLDSVTLTDGSVLRPVALAPTVTMRRVADACTSSTSRESIWYADKGESTGVYNIPGYYAATMAQALSDGLISNGLDNVFVNDAAQFTCNNIERMDYVHAPFTVEDTVGDGYFVAERGGNDPFLVAAVTAVDADGNPTALSAPYRAPSSGWGSPIYDPGTTLVAQRDGTADIVATNEVAQRVHGRFVTAADLHVAAGTTIYGFVMAATDVTATAAALLDYRSFPTSSLDGGGIDLVATPLMSVRPQLTLTKALGGPRSADSDEFTVQIHTGSATGPVVNATARSTTTGSGATVDPGTGTTGRFTGVTGTTYYLNEVADGTSDLAQYTQRITCTDATGRQAGLPTDEPLGTAWAIRPAVGTDIACTITNTPRPARLSLVKALGSSRQHDSDQFTVRIHRGSDDGPVVNDTVNSTTSGTGSTVAPGTGTPGSYTTTPGTTYSLDEAGSGDTDLDQYDQRISCVDANGFQTGLPSGEPLRAALELTPAAGADITCTLTNSFVPAPAISIVKSATPGEVDAVGDTVQYSFLVTNTGNVPLTDVHVDDTLAAPAGPALAITCPTTTLAAGATTTCTATYAATQADLDHGSIDNTATATGTPPVGDPVTSEPSTATVEASTTSGISLAKSAAISTDANGDGLAGVDDRLTFSFLVTNTGTVTLTDVEIHDELAAPAGPALTVTCPVTVLAPGASVTCTSNPYLVTQADVDNGSVANTATATATPPSGDPIRSGPSSTTTPTPTDASIGLVKSAAISTDANGDGLAGVDDEVTFSFLVTNTGPVTLTDVAVDDTLVAPAGPAVAVTCPNVPLPPGMHVTCTSSPYRVTQADVDHGKVDNSATASASPPSGAPVTSAPSTTSTPTPDIAVLELVKTASVTTDADGDGKLGVGDELTFGFVVTNTGVVTLHDIAIDDQLVAPAGPAVTVSCPQTTLDPAESMTCTSSPYRVTQADVDSGKVANSATATGTPPSGDPVVSEPSSTSTPTLDSPGISLRKSASLSADANGDGLAGVGDQLTFSFLVTNTGAVTLHDVAVTDQLVAPAGPAVAVTCPRTTLAPTESMTCTSSPYAVTQADVDNGKVANTATAAGTPSGGDPISSDPSSTSTPTPTRGGLALVKTVRISSDANDDDLAGVGDELTFGFLVTNTGAVTLHDVAIDDQLVAPAGPAVSVTCPGTTLAPGASMTCTSSAYPVGQADVDHGSVANTATASGATPTGDPVVSDPSDTTTPTPSAAVVGLVKTAALSLDRDGDGRAGVGDEITFGFTVTNTGAVTLHDVAVDDQLVAPAGPAVSVTCPGTTLAPGASMTCTSSRYVVTQADVDHGSVANSATASGTPPTGGPVTSDPSTTSTPTPGDASISLQKTAALTADANGDGRAGVGDEITFSFLVTNTGVVTLHDVAIRDQLVAPAGPAVSVTCPGTILAPGASMTCTSSPYLVTRADAAEGEVANTATATGMTPDDDTVTSRPSTTSVPTPRVPGTLAYTGTDTGMIAVLGLLLLAAGALLIANHRYPK